MRNFFADIPAALPAEQLETWLSAEHLRIERIISRGHIAPADGGWYEQREHEWVMILQGAAQLECVPSADAPSEIRHMGAGDTLFIPARQPHRVIWTPADQDTVWLAVFFPPGGHLNCSM